MSIKDIVLAFAEGKEGQEGRDRLKREITRVARALNLEHLLKSRVGDDFAEEILSVLRLKLLSIIDTVKEKEFITVSYIRKVIRSCIVDVLNGDFNISTLSIENINYENEEGRVVRFEEKLGTEEDRDLNISTEELFKRIVDILGEKDMKVLCYYICKEIYGREIKLTDITKDNLYKRWERLKRKIAKNLSYIPNEKEFKEFAEKYMSEICEKRGYIK